MKSAAIKLCCVGLLCGGVSVATAADPPAKPLDAKSSASPAAPLSPADRTFWQQNWKRIAMAYAVVGDDFFAFPQFDPKFPSSTHVTVDGWLAEHTTSSRVTNGGIAHNVDSAPPREEALAAATRIPSFAPGAYGYIASAKVVEVVGPQEMIVTEVRLVDPEEVEAAKKKIERMKQVAEAKIQDEQKAERDEQQRQQQNRSNTSSGVATTVNQSETDARTRRREQLARDSQELRQFTKDAAASYEVRQKAVELQSKIAGGKLRLLGFSTGAVSAGATWKVSETGMQIVLPPAGATAAADKTAKGKKPLLALSAESFMKPMPEPQFMKLLQECDMTQAGWVVFARDLMKKNAGDDRLAIVTAMEAARKKKLDDAAEAVKEAAVAEKQAALDAKKVDADAKKAAAEEKKAASAEKRAADLAKRKADAEAKKKAKEPAVEPAPDSQ
jgi:hypothetical protein